ATVTGVQTCALPISLIRRGRDLGWYIKTRDFTRRLGEVAKSYKSKDALPPRAARAAAARLLIELRTAPKEKTDAAPIPFWTWAEIGRASCRDSGELG